MLMSKIFPRMLVGTSVVLYYAIFGVLMGSTKFCNSCSASTLWKYGLIASLPTWLVFLYLYSIRRNNPLVSAARMRGCTSLLLGLVLILVSSMWLVPLLTFLAFRETYDIVYFDPIRFPFSLAITVLLSITLGLMSYNLRTAWSHGAIEEKRSQSTCWHMVGVNFSLIGWVVQILQHLGLTNEPVAFGILLISTTSIPIFSQVQGFLEKLLRTHPGAMRKIQYVGLGTLATAVGILDFLTGYPLWHPFLVVALWSTMGACISSTIGQCYSYGYDTGGRTTRSMWAWLSLAVLLLVLLVVLTWFYSHAAVSAWLSEIIHV